MSHAGAAAAVPPELGGAPAEELAYRLRQQRILADFGLFALSCRDLDELLQSASKLCADGLITRYCKVLEYLPEQNRFLVRAGVGWHDGVVGHATIGADLESPAGFAFKTAQSVISNHLQSESRFRTPQLLEEHGIKRAINVVISGGADTPPFGVLEADSAQEGRFEEADLAFMQGFANLLGVAIDRHRADQQRRRSEQHLRTIVEHAPQKMWVNQADGSVLQFNKAWCDYTGQPITPEGLGWTEAIHPEDRPRLAAARARAIASGEGYDIELRIRRASDGACRWHVGSVNPLKEADQVYGWVGTATDIHDIRTAQAALDEERARLDAVVRTVPVGLVIAEAPSGRIVMGNSQTEQIFRHPILPSPNIEAYKEWVAYHSDGRQVEGHEFPLARALLEGQPTPPEEYCFERGDGTRGWIQLQAAPVRDASGTVTAAVVAIVDIDDQKRTEQALRQTEERYRLAARATNDAIWDWDLTTDEIHWNEAVQTLFGYQPDDVPPVGAWWKEHIHPDDRVATVASIEAATAGTASHWTAEYRFRRADSFFAYVVDRGSIIRDARGKPLRMVGAMLDLTERRQAEERQRLLTHELEHRIKNTLAMVQAIVSQTLRGAPSTRAANVAISSRLVTLGRAHDILTQAHWAAAQIRTVVEGALAPHDPGNRIRIAGPDLHLAAQAALSLALTLHELATNAAKYGALSNQMGQVDVTWEVVEQEARRILRLRWEETGGPPVMEPMRKGFGSRLIERSLSSEAGGQARMDFAPTGLVCTIETPLGSMPTA
jgi:PAS domain S-box-containing protein